ncbi:MAG: MotA/TolQ/ExbB proton channel family protein [Myxococcales bacterium]|nr:MotA/TolQ/ExbB proton channel family protein [Myxococcales bacterium]MCB9736218.1 MotA/TolQ/ExbB proton channel family protein [Deltaproteobacteria bacterium]
MDLAELFERGGPLMWVILGASLVAAAAFIDRLIALRRSVIAPQSLFTALENHLRAGDAARAAQLCREQRTLLSGITASGLEKRRRGRAAAKEAMEESGAVAIGGLESWVNVLATVAAVAPLLGLLGTVTGMIEVFYEVERAVTPDIARLSGGIKEALYTTGAGLTVGIPVYVAYRYVESRIDRFAQELEAKSLALLDLMVPAGVKGEAPVEDDAEGEA